MNGAADLKTCLREYLCQLGRLAVKPAQFFSEAAMPDSRQAALYALPPVLVLVIGTLAMGTGLLWALVTAALVTAGLALWSLVLKYVLIPFGEKRSFQELWRLNLCSALPLSLAWIPWVGGPLAAVLVAFWNFTGLVNRFGMNRGAAAAAIGLPVVVVGLGGTMLSLLFLMLASLSTMFSGR